VTLTVWELFSVLLVPVLLGVALLRLQGVAPRTDPLAYWGWAWIQGCLGLALVHRAVEAHRGAILVDSPAGAGACFTIYLPAHAGRELGDGDRAS